MKPRSESEDDSSSSSGSESAFNPPDVSAPNELEWFHTGAKVHILAFMDDDGKEVPICRQLEGQTLQNGDQNEGSRLVRRNRSPRVVQWVFEGLGMRPEPNRQLLTHATPPEVSPGLHKFSRTQPTRPSGTRCHHRGWGLPHGNP